MIARLKEDRIASESVVAEEEVLYCDMANKSAPAKLEFENRNSRRRRLLYVSSGTT